jgi:hypothetical protein
LHTSLYEFAKLVLLRDYIIRCALMLVSVSLWVVILKRLLPARYKPRLPQWLGGIHRAMTSKVAAVASTVLLISGIAALSFIAEIPVVGRMVFFLIASVAFAWFVSIVLLTRLLPSAAEKLRRLFAAREKRGWRNKAEPAAAVFAATFTLMLAVFLSPEDRADRAFRSLESMSRGVSLIELTVDRWDKSSPRVKVADSGRLAVFSHLLAGSQPILLFSSSPNRCYAVVHTKSGETLELYVAYHSLHGAGVHIEVTTPHCQVTFRNDEIGRLFADTLGIQME